MQTEICFFSDTLLKFLAYLFPRQLHLSHFTVTSAQSGTQISQKCRLAIAVKNSHLWSDTVSNKKNITTGIRNLDLPFEESTWTMTSGSFED